ncbi:MAG TPA: hypothetical protein VH000_11635 [Rhizomicrobium sp.]|nr:hypothetical protein [Rhizomicrobium sp.]
MSSADATEEKLLARLRALDSCALSDALDRLGCPPSVSGIEPRTKAQRIAGRVLTVRLAAGSGGSARHLCTTAIEAAKPGDVIVVEQRTGIDAAGWGGILSRAAQARGLSGVIVEGPARDIDEATQIGFPVYARGVTPRTARGRIHEAATGEPIHVGEGIVAAGDYVLADASGVVFLPATQVGEIITAAEQIAARERAMTADLESGKPVSSVMGASYESMLKR